jgi:hypothetical protein
VTGQEKSELYPENETNFFEPLDRYDISFQIKERQVESLEIFQGGQKILAKKIN